MASQPAFYTLYRQTSIGLALADSIDTLIENKNMTPALANSLMSLFDKVMAQEFVKVKTALAIKAEAVQYRFCDEVWTFELTKVECKFNDKRNFVVDLVPRDGVRMVACNSKPCG